MSKLGSFFIWIRYCKVFLVITRAYIIKSSLLLIFCMSINIIILVRLIDEALKYIFNQPDQYDQQTRNNQDKQ